MSQAVSQLQSKVSELRGRVQSQVSSLRSKIMPGGGAQVLGGGTLSGQIQNIRKRFTGGSGSMQLTSLPVIERIRTQGLLGGLKGGPMMQMVTNAGFRGFVKKEEPGPQVPPTPEAGGYRPFT